MTTPELCTKVRETLGYPDSYLKDEVIARYMDEAMSNLACNVLPARLRGAVNVPITAGVDTYTVTGQQCRIFAVNLDGSKFLQPYTLTRLEREAPTWSSESGTPDKFWLEGVDPATGELKIRVHPKPSVGGTLVVSTVAKPKNLLAYGNNEVAQWDELGQAAAVFYAAWRHGGNGNVIVDPAKMQLWWESFSRIQDMLRSYEDPTSAQAQEANNERGWRLPQ